MPTIAQWLTLQSTFPCAGAVCKSRQVLHSTEHIDVGDIEWKFELFLSVVGYHRHVASSQLSFNAKIPSSQVASSTPFRKSYIRVRSSRSIFRGSYLLHFRILNRWQVPHRPGCYLKASHLVGFEGNILMGSLYEGGWSGQLFRIHWGTMFASDEATCLLPLRCCWRTRSWLRIFQEQD